MAEFMDDKWRDNIGAILARASSGALIVMVAGAGLAFLSQVLIARILGATEYGIYIYVLTWINLLSIAVTLGLNTSLLRFVPAYIARLEWGLLRGLLRRVTWIVLAASLLISVVTSCAVWFFSDHIDKSHVNVFFIALLLLPLIGLTQLRSATMRGLKLIVKALAPENLVRPILLMLLAGSAYWLMKNDLTAFDLMTLNVVGAMLAFALGTYWLYGALPPQIKYVQEIYADRDWIKISLPMFVMSAMTYVWSHADILMLGAMINAEQAGIYAVASRIATLVAFGLVAVNTIVAPMISQYYSVGNHASLQRMITLSAQGVFVFSLVVSIVLWLSGPTLLGLFGSEFSVGYDVVTILLAGQIVNALAGSVGFIMIMTKHQKEAAWIVSICAAINIALNYLLIPQFGLEGAAIATALTMVIRNVCMVVFVLNILKINPTIFTRKASQ